MKSLQDECYEARTQQRKTAQIIADESGIPFSTVNNFFAAASKHPSVYTVGPICKSLGVSLDHYFGIVPTDDLTEHQKDMLTQQVDYEKEMNRLITSNSKTKDRIIIAMLVVLILALIYGITLDILNPSIGIFRH